MPPLNSWQIIPVPPPTLPSATGPRCRAVERREHVLGLHVKAVDVVEIAVPGLGHHRQRPPVLARRRVAWRTAPGDDRVAHDADAVRVRDHHRALRGSRTPRARCVPVISPLPFSENQPAEAPDRRGSSLPRGRIAVTPVRTACLRIRWRSASSGRPHARHVGDRVQRARRAIERDAEIARARRRRCRYQCSHGEQDSGAAQQLHHKLRHKFHSSHHDCGGRNGREILHAPRCVELCAPIASDVRLEPDSGERVAQKNVNNTPTGG